MKKKVLSGIQPSGKLHIGNYFGMIKRMVEYQESSDLFLFIANLHSLTTLQDKDRMKTMTLEAATDLLALGIDPCKCHFWVQSDVPEVAELTWILSCITPMGLMERAHSFKDKIAKGIKPNLGLFCYPALMTADILINQSEVIPVGKDQKQHVEMARDIAIKFNNQFGDVFTIPEPDILEDVAVVPGTDGQKMSKSYGNTIPIFDEPSVIKKAVMGIVTDSKGVDAPKAPEKCHVFALYKLFATAEERTSMAGEYRKGKIGYGDAKKALLERIQNTFEPFQKKRAELTARPKEVERILEEGAEKVRKITLKTLEQVRTATGLRY
ncbi:tryptophan--tRNA ligase [Patescibacteria group bacterium]|nr:tryptophan--tRNA ligase [Patescibacteria group bacterium]MBU1016324.1 tryptophan--tRNA ligase [Patescibacteria group bacterium]MBU1685027.1 tryptophan--tRNA ligase [Patescibacteria group bacterium]MBU1938835.1 tryptophan--tRNA ligase [Patescibacteria group bacterium]